MVLGCSCWWLVNNLLLIKVVIFVSRSAVESSWTFSCWVLACLLGDSLEPPLLLFLFLLVSPFLFLRLLGFFASAFGIFSVAILMFFDVVGHLFVLVLFICCQLCCQTSLIVG